MNDPSSFLTVAFAVVALATVVAVLLVTRRVFRNPNRVAMIIGVWLGLTSALAAIGALRFDTRPPTIVLVILAANGAAIYLAFSRIGTRIAETVPFAALIGLQAFRLPLELVMHRAATEGVMPAQMSFSGLNFDIVTGITAIVVARLAHKRGLVVAWNLLGSFLLVAIIVIATLSAPLPIRMFGAEPPNVWITRAPFVWLVSFLVPVALAGHLILWRKLRRRQGDGAAVR